VLKKHLNRILHGRAKAQGMVEFALVIPLFLLVLVGVIEFGFFFFIYSSVNSAAREAARFGSAAGDSGSGVLYYQNCQGIREAAKRIGSYSGVQDAQISVGLDQGPDTVTNWAHCPVGQASTTDMATLGDRIVVRIVVQYNPIVSMLGFPPITVRAVSARTIVTAMELEGTPYVTRTVQYTRTPTQTIAALNTPTPTQVGGDGGEDATPTPTSTPVQETPVSQPTVCLTPLELGGCE
jgi:Flp pilus assembly protein TadG